MQTTLRAKIHDPSFSPVLDQMGEHFGQAKRSIFKELKAKKRSINEIKKDALLKHGLTSRQFNSIRFELQGLIASNQENKSRWIEKIKHRIAKKKEQLKNTLNLFKRHHLGRKIKSLEKKLVQFQEDFKDPSVCFGGRQLFHQQFQLEENGFANHEEWKKEWQEARSSVFFLIGSKDEKFGNQSCQFLPGKLQLRLTDRIAKSYGKKTIQIPLEFTYREEVIQYALSVGQAMNYRFVKENGFWYVHLTTEMEVFKQVTDRSKGALGIDLNPACIALTHIGTDGNLIHSWQIDLTLRGRSSHQIQATLGEAVAQCVQYARTHQIPVVIEKLDFEKKKEELRSRHLNRMLSQFAYSAFSKLMTAQCYRAGVELIEVNPAYTSVIGKFKFSEGYGISTHMAAAMAIARRGLDFGERLRTKTQNRSPLPARNRGRHVWLDWARLSREARRRKKAPSRRPRSKRTRGDRRSSSVTPSSGSPPGGLH
jgi:IS605 OrfB family transposase